MSKYLTREQKAIMMVLEGLAVVAIDASDVEVACMAYLESLGQGYVCGMGMHDLHERHKQEVEEYFDDWLKEFSR